MSSPRAVTASQTGPPRLWFAIFLGFLLAGLLSAQGQSTKSNKASPVHSSAWAFNSTIPLGTDLLLLQPAKMPVSLLVSAESNEFKNWTLVEDGDGKRTVVGADGKPVKKMPSQITFRVTAGTKDKITEEQPYPITAVDSNLNDFLLGLRFRLKIYRGMDVRVVEPQDTRIIGVPADEPYEERIFRTAFNVGDVDIRDRVVLEVFQAKSDQRISKFHLEF
jgi:hypothetical protein